MGATFLALLLVAPGTPSRVSLIGAGSAGASQLAVPALPATPSEALLRQLIAETALAQLREPDPRWEERQRDCAGLVRFAYRTAYARLAPDREARGLFAERDGEASAFADARTLIATRFERVGRSEDAVRAAESGDVLAFQQGPAGEEVMHLMLVVRPGDPAHGQAAVVYHTGTPGAPLRAGPLNALLRDAPQEWRPVESNPAFLGVYRWEEFGHG